MKFIKTRDVSNRKFFKSYEVESKVLKFLQVRLLNDPHLCSNIDRSAILKYLLAKKISCKKSKILFRCVLTNRSRGNLRKFNVSRIVLKKAIGLGLLPGYTKSIW